MRPTPFAVLVLLLAGCSQPAWPEAFPPAARTLEAFDVHDCVTSLQHSDGTVGFVVVGCPVRLGQVDLSRSGLSTLPVPAGSTGLLLEITMPTTVVGTLNLTVAGGPYRWPLEFTSYYAEDRSQGGLLPRNLTSSPLSYTMSVCGIHEAEVSIQAVGYYAGAVATVSALVPEAPHVVDGREVHLVNGTATCNGGWPYTPPLAPVPGKPAAAAGRGD
jgi:hypothetical protein